MCIIRFFADDTRVNKKIKTNEDKELMQKDLDAVYRWAEKNKMKFNEKKFEQMAHGPLKGVTIEPYKTSSGEDIEIKETVKDLGVLATNDLMFKEHIGKITTECRVIMADLMRTFSIREREPMIKLFNLCIKGKLEYCCVIWSPSADDQNQNGMNMIEKIQQAFTKKDRRLGKLRLPSEMEKM